VTINEPQVSVAIDAKNFIEAVDAAVKTAPTFRAVDQFTGTIAEASAAIDALTTQRDDARAERDNMVDTAIELGRVANYLKHTLADLEDMREQRDEWRDRHDEAQCRMDEMAAEIRDLRTELATARNERDTAKAGSIW
jgi:chromosome segregation ATPase